MKSNQKQTFFKCLIITKKVNLAKIDLKEFDLFIGVEMGAISLFAFEKIEAEKKWFISDFDSINAQELAILKKDISLKRLKILSKDKAFSDTEEAIILAHKHGYFKDDIVVLIDEERSRKEHLLNLFFLTYKYQILIIGNKLKFFPLKAKKENVIRSDGYQFLSIFLFKKTRIYSKGLKWDLNNKSFNQKNATTLISNQILQSSASIRANRTIVIIQSND